MTTEQEEFWRGSFGDEYNQRNRGELLIANNMKFWRRILGNYLNFPNRWRPKIIEFGAGNGMNLVALGRLGCETDKMSAVEINHSACEELRLIPGISVYETSIFDGAITGEYGAQPSSFGQYDLVISSGLLIHIDPDDINRAYEALHYACVPGGTMVLAEYFSPTPTPVVYRGHEGKLWSRPYGDDMLDSFSDLELQDYGFVSKRDKVCPRDNLTWWILQKKA